MLQSFQKEVKFVIVHFSLYRIIQNKCRNPATIRHRTSWKVFVRKKSITNNFQSLLFISLLQATYFIITVQKIAPDISKHNAFTLFSFCPADCIAHGVCQLHLVGRSIFSRVNQQNIQNLIKTKPRALSKIEAKADLFEVVYVQLFNCFRYKKLKGQDKS